LYVGVESDAAQSAMSSVVAGPTPLFLVNILSVALSFPLLSGKNRKLMALKLFFWKVKVDLRILMASNILANIIVSRR
jgi:hypothetical protein